MADARTADFQDSNNNGIDDRDENKNKVNAKTKAQRQQHRKDHNTDADRQINKEFRGDQKGRRAAKMQAYAQQGNESAADFNFDQHGKGHVSGGEIKALRKQGQSRADIMSAAKASGGEIGEKAQNRFDRWDARAAEKAKQPKEAAQDFLEEKKQPIQDSFNTTDSFNTDTDTKGSFNTSIDQDQSFDRNFGNNENTIGDDNNFYGNVNQGNQDFSINIGNQQAGAGGTAGGGTMSNAAEGAAAKAGFENTWERSNAKFNPTAFAASNVAAADQLGGTSDLIKGLDRTTDANIDYYRKASDRGTLGLYGDIWNMKAPTWKAPGDLDKIETTYDKDKDDEE